MDELDLHFVDTLMGKTAEGRDPGRWNIPLIHTPHRTLTKRDVFNYYSHPTVRAALLAQVRGRPSIVVQKFEGAPTLRRLNDRKEPIVIAKDSGDVDDPSDYQYWIERRAVEFHPVLSDKTDNVFVDIDPKAGFSWKDTKNLAADIHDLMDAHPSIHEPEIRYSGGDGFHVVGKLDSPLHVDDARLLAKTLVAPILEKEPRTTLGEAGPGHARLDVSTLKQAGSLRGLYSLNHETGLACIPVEPEHLADFEKESASIRSVLGHIPRNAVSLRP